jgi:hypothetical protein
MTPNATLPSRIVDSDKPLPVKIICQSSADANIKVKLTVVQECQSLTLYSGQRNKQGSVPVPQEAGMQSTVDV